MAESLDGAAPGTWRSLLPATRSLLPATPWSDPAPGRGRSLRDVDCKQQVQQVDTPISRRSVVSPPTRYTAVYSHPYSFIYLQRTGSGTYILHGELCSSPRHAMRDSLSLRWSTGVCVVWCEGSSHGQGQPAFLERGPDSSRVIFQVSSEREPNEAYLFT